LGKLTFIIGGARSGKSTYAEDLASQIGGSTIYIATAQPLDQEMATRIRNHRLSRPSHWKTLEIPSGIASHAAAIPRDTKVILLDCLTLLVSNLLMNQTNHDNHLDEGLAQKSVGVEITSLLELIDNTSAHWIIVSNEVGMGLVPPYPLGRIYRDQLGWANQQIALHADEVILMIAGLPWLLTPAEQL